MSRWHLSGTSICINAQWQYLCWCHIVIIWCRSRASCFTNSEGQSIMIHSHFTGYLVNCENELCPFITVCQIRGQIHLLLKIHEIKYLLHSEVWLRSVAWCLSLVVPCGLCHLNGCNKRPRLPAHHLFFCFMLNVFFFSNLYFELSLPVYFLCFSCAFCYRQDMNSIQC